MGKMSELDIDYQELHDHITFSLATIRTIETDLKHKRAILLDMRRDCNNLAHKIGEKWDN